MKKVKTSLVSNQTSTQVNESNSLTTHPQKGSLKSLLISQQTLTKSTVQQLHLIPKLNSVSFETSDPKVRTLKTCLQFNLLLAMKENLEFQSKLSNWGTIKLTGLNEIIAVIDGVFKTMVNFEKKANTKMKLKYDLRSNLIIESCHDFMDHVFENVKSVIDKWNSEILKTTSQKFGTLQKSPIDLANDINLESEKILSMYKPSTNTTTNLGKRNDIEQNPTDWKYEDTKMIHELLKDLLTMGNSLKAELKNEVIFHNTENYLKGRENRKSSRKEKTEYDERKDRKIKYDLHEKIIGFMPSFENKEVVENRDEILANLFGRKNPKSKKEQAKIEEKEDYFGDIDLF